MGKQPKGLQDMIVLGVSYQQRANAYFGLLTEDWPSFTDPQNEALAGAPSSSGLPPAPASPAPPAAPEAPGGQSRTGTGGLPPGSKQPVRRVAAAQAAAAAGRSPTQ